MIHRSQSDFVIGTDKAYLNYHRDLVYLVFHEGSDYLLAKVLLILKEDAVGRGVAGHVRPPTIFKLDGTQDIGREDSLEFLLDEITPSVLAELGNSPSKRAEFGDVRRDEGRSTTNVAPDHVPGIRTETISVEEARERGVHVPSEYGAEPNIPGLRTSTPRLTSTEIATSYSSADGFLDWAAGIAVAAIGE